MTTTITKMTVGKYVDYRVIPAPPCWGLWKNGRENGAKECSNIGVRGGTYDAVKLEKGEKLWAVRSYADVTREDVKTPLGQNRLIIP